MCERSGVKKNARNLYLKRGTYWFSQQVKGKRAWVNLQTLRRSRGSSSAQDRPGRSNYASGDRLVAGSRCFHRVQAQQASIFDEQCRYQGAQPAISCSLASGQRNACHCDFRSVRAMSPSGAKTWFRQEKPAKPASETTAYSYMITLRAILRWVVEVRRVHFDNPVEKLDLPAVEHKTGSDSAIRRKTLCLQRQQTMTYLHSSLRI